MKETILEKAKKGTTTLEKLNLLREELHHLILQEIDRKGGFEKLCFQGGTALRILFGLDRFSEDLDFCTSSEFKSPFHLETLALSVTKSIQAFGLSCELTHSKNVMAVHGCFFQFSDLLSFVSSSFQKSQKLAIKMEVDTHPPTGAHEEVSPVTGVYLYKIRHHALSSLFAGKLHAVLYRQYTKGRDLYDFLWYAAKKTPVNAKFLENATYQTQKTKIQYTQEKLREALKARFQKIDFEAAKKDVERFVSNTASLSLFQKDIFLNATEKIEIQES